jgi:hypothetical protein
MTLNLGQFFTLKKLICFSITNRDNVGQPEIFSCEIFRDNRNSRNLLQATIFTLQIGYFPPSAVR